MVHFTTSHFLLMGINFSTAVIGIILLTYGVLLNMGKTFEYVNVTPSIEAITTLINEAAKRSSCAIFIIVIGFCIIALSSLGLCGAYIEHPFALKVSQNAIDEILTSRLSQYEPEKISSNLTIVPPLDYISVVMFAMQLSLGCCGIKGPHTYLNIPWERKFTIHSKTISAVVPPSCCYNETSGITAHVSMAFYERLPMCLSGTESHINQIGCSRSLSETLKTASTVICVAGGVLLILEGAALWSAKVLSDELN